MPLEYIENMLRHKQDRPAQIITMTHNIALTALLGMCLAGVNRPLSLSIYFIMASAFCTYIIFCGKRNSERSGIALTIANFLIVFLLLI